MATKKRVSLKLLIDNDSKKVVFAEAGKDFVDFLFGLLQIPLGAIIGRLWEKGMAGSGSFGRLYESVINLDPNFLQANLDKDILLRPEMPSSSNTNSTLPLLEKFVTKKRKHEFDYSSNPFAAIKRASDQVASPSKEEGYVKGMLTYMVTDDLDVKPMSTISSITILNTFRVKDVGSLVEKTVEINLEKGLEMVKASFVSDTVLTDVFVWSK